MILSICDLTEVKKIMRIIKIVILLIRIAVPIILIVVGMLDFMKATSSGDDATLKKTLSQFVRRIIAAVLVFLIPTFVSAIFTLIGANTEYKKCFGYNNIDSNTKLVYVENK